MLLLGCGAVSRCLQPLLLRHLDMDFRGLTIVDFVDRPAGIEPVPAAGARYRPTVHFAYLPSDAGPASLHECRMRGYRMQSSRRIMLDELVEGMDELGVLLLGHDLDAWWTGSRLDIEQARSLVPGQNATTVQVAASVLGALRWMLRNPNRGLCVPDDLDHEEVLGIAEPYLGKCPSTSSEWTPLSHGDDSLGHAPKNGGSADPWQFENVLVG